MDVYLAAAVTGLSYVVFPITVVLYYLLLLVVFIGKILYGPVNAFLQPFIFIGLSIWWIVSFPFHILARLEPLYNFIGAAVITGVLIGLALNFALKQSSSAIGFDWLLSKLPSNENNGPTAREYRLRKEKERFDGTPLASQGYLSLSDTASSRKRSSKSLTSQTILEEVDSEY